MRFWPAGQPAQLDYERLREQALNGIGVVGAEAECFARGGLAALIRKPHSVAPPLVATLVVVPRPRWSPYEDPRLASLADAYELLTSALAECVWREEDARCE